MTKSHFQTYLAMGWKLFPIRCQDEGEKEAKSPLTPHGFKDASSDLAQIEAWFHQFPGCAWAVATTADHAIIDTDVKNDGPATLDALIAEHGPLPVCPKVRTGGGGFHYWLKFPAGTGSSVGWRKGIDRKAEGGYAIIPPSRILLPEHGGRAYAWEIRPWDVPIPEAPSWLLGKGEIQSQGKGKGESPSGNPWIVQASGDDLSSHPGSKEGERNTTCARLVGVHLARGDSPSTIRALASAWAEKCNPAFEGWEKHVDGLIRKEKGKRMTTSLSPAPSPAALSPLDMGRKEGSGHGLEPEPEGDTSFLPSHGEKEEGEGEGEILPSFLPADETGESEEGGGRGCLSSPLPVLRPEAYHGLFGDMLRAIEPETEADPAGILLGWLTCFGNVAGRGAWVQVGPRRHHPALFVGVCGLTSDAKGDSWAVALHPFRLADQAWASACIANGIGSGEGLIERICDEQTVMDREGNAKVLPGASDKRCLLRLSELSRCFKAGRRENATLSEYLREAWDGEPIHVPNRRANALSSTDYTVSIVGDITPGVIRKTMEVGTEAFDGFANRFLWCVVRSPRDLPSGGNVDVLAPFLPALADALAFGKGAGALSRNPEAEGLWEKAYPILKRAGDAVPHTDRARPYVVRLSMLFALADRSTVIKADHMRAALAVWDYCRASAALTFAPGKVEGVQAPPDPLWLRFLNAIKASPGINRTGLREIAGHKTAVEDIEKALAGLEEKGWAHWRMVKPKGRGCPAECWFPGVKPSGGNNDNVAPPSLSSPSSSFGEGREGSNSGEEALGDEPEPRGGNSGEGGNSLEPGGTELLPSLPVPEAKSADEEERVAVVIVPTFAHEASGSMGTGGGAARPPYPPSSFKTAGRDDAGNLLIVPHHDATDEPLPPQEPGESDGDHLERCLRAC